MTDTLKNDMPAPLLPKKSPQSDQLVQDMLREKREFRQKQRDEVAAAKQNTPDKQPFDINMFGNLYNLRDDDGELRITPELVEDYEAEYYLKNPDIKSLQDFATHKIRLDQESAS